MLIQIYNNRGEEVGIVETSLTAVTAERIIINAFKKYLDDDEAFEHLEECGISRTYVDLGVYLN